MNLFVSVQQTWSPCSNAASNIQEGSNTDYRQEEQFVRRLDQVCEFLVLRDLLQFNISLPVEPTTYNELSQNVPLAILENHGALLDMSW